MSQTLPLMNSFVSFQIIEAQVEAAVKSGNLTREQAKKIMTEARENYSKQTYNRKIEAVNRMQK
jgi:urease accessory protein UreF